MPVATQAFIPIGVDPVAPLTDTARDAALERSDLSATLLIQRLRQSRIAINRIASPRLIEQLLHSATRPIDSVVCAALDSDEACGVNGAIATAFPSDVRLGVQLLSNVVRASRSFVVADAALRSSRLAGRRTTDAPRLLTLDHTYPQLHPVLLLRTVLKRRLAAGRLPVEVGAIVVDAAAAWTIGRLIAGDVSVAVPLCIRDHRTRRTVFAAVAPELSLWEVLSSLNIGGPAEGEAVIAGELLLRHRADLSTCAGESASVLHLCPGVGAVSAEPCVRCNWCADVCPTGVLPMLALEAAQFKEAGLADRSAAEACIDCGLCDYVCPSKLPLVESTHIARHLVSTVPLATEHDTARPSW